jgi:hypothetical protein
MAYETLSEKILNGKPIDWNYWARLKNITPNQAAKLANRIDPIKWPNNKCHLGDIPEDIQILIRSLEQRLENQKLQFTLQELTQHIGNDSPEGMLEQVSIQTNLVKNIIHKNQVVNSNNSSLKRASQLHIFIWRVYKVLCNKQPRTNPTAQNVWREIKNNFEEYDSDKIIQEISDDDEIVWFSGYGNEQSLKRSSFDKTLSVIKKNPLFK